jgi:PAS domain S-box-containing protein
MHTKDTNPDNAAELRRQAEEMARRKGARTSEDLETLSPEETRQMLHELRVHQIELEMQNEELRRTQVELEASRARYFKFYDLAPVGYVTVNEEGLITEANLTAATLLGVDRSALIRRPLSNFILPEDQDIYYRHRNQLFEEGKTQICVLRIPKADAVPLWAQIETTVVKDIEGAFVCRVMIRDTTDRKRAEESAKARFRMVDAATTKSSEELMQIALDEIEAQTGSSIGFYHFILPDQETIVLQTWSTNTLNFMCTAEGQYSHYPISQGGVWVDCIRQRGPVIHNDYVSLPHRKGMPEGHVQVVRELTFPIIRNDRIVAVMGVGNKKTDYNDTDVEVALLLGDFSWELIERKRAEEALRSSEERHRTILQTAMDGFWIMDMKGRLLEVNEVYCRMSGYSKQELLTMSISDLEASESTDEIAAHIQKIMTQGEDRFESKHLRKDGTIFDIEVSVQYHPFGGGQVVVFLHDITERKRAEEALRESERLYRAIGESIDYGVWVCAPDGRNTYASQSFLRMVGLTQEECSNFGWGNVLHPDDAERTIEAWKECVSKEGTWDIEHRFWGVDGQWHAVLARGVPVRNERNEIICWAGINLDISELKQTEEALRQSREDLNRAQEVGQVGSWRLNVRLNVLTWSDEAYRIFGLPKGTPLTYETFLEIVHPDDREYVDTQWTAGLRGEPYDIEHRIVVNGQSKWVREKAYLEFDETGALLGGFGISQDITERKRTEEALRGSEANLARAQSISHLANWELDIETEKVRGSKELYRLFNLAADFTLGGYVEKFHPDDRAYVVDSINAAIHEGKPYSIDYRIIPRADDIRHVHAQGEVAYDQAGLPIKFFGTVQDITERKQAEEKIKTLLKEKELLLREVHHRLKNNMLVMITLLTLQAKTLKSPEAVAALEDAKGRLQSQYVLYDKLYNKDKLEEMSTTDYIPALVNKIIGTFPDQTSIKIETQVDEFLLGVETFFPLGIIINELLTNCLKYAFIGRDDGLIIVSAALKDHRVTLVIEDNGIGLPESIDLKTSGGFGLKLIGMLTSQLYGTIRIEREKGTRFILEFEI